MKKTKYEKAKEEEKTESMTGNDTFVVAIVGGKQHLLHEGDVIKVANLNKEAGQKIGDFEVLLYGRGGEFSFGTPYLSKIGIEAEVLENFKGKKLDVVKFKAKSRYSKKIGYRSKLTKIKILKITGEGHGS